MFLEFRITNDVETKSRQHEVYIFVCGLRQATENDVEKNQSISGCFLVKTLRAFQFDKVNICWASQNTFEPNNNVHTYPIYSARIVDVHTNWFEERIEWRDKVKASGGKRAEKNQNPNLNPSLSHQTNLLDFQQQHHHENWNSL